MSDEPPDPNPQGQKRPLPDPLENQDKALTEDPKPQRPQPDELRRVEEGDYRGGRSDGG